MKKIVIAASVLILVVCFCTGMVMAGKKSQPSDHINWLSYKQGMDLAKKTKKRVYLHFYTDWCNYCQEMDQTTFRDSSVIKMLNETFIAIRVDTNKETAVAGRYKIRPVPDNWFLAADGTKLKNFLGYYEPAQFVTLLRYVNEKL